MAEKSVEELADRIEAYVCRKDHVSFAELSRDLEGFKGDSSILAPRNCVIWSGLSSDAFEALQMLRHSKRIHYELVGGGFIGMMIVYGGDGMTLNLPLAERPPKQGYKEPHWIPTVLRPGGES